MKLIILLLLLSSGVLYSQSDKSNLVKEGTQSGMDIYKDSTSGKFYATGLMEITPDGFVLPDGTPSIIFPKELTKLEYEYIIAFIKFRLLHQKLFK